MDSSHITTDDLKAAEKIAGISFSEEERKAVLEDVASFPKRWETLRTPPISYLVEPPTVFTPLHGGSRPNAKVSARVSSVKAIDVKKLSEEDIAFLSVRELGSLVRARKISPVALTHLYLDRLKRYGDKLLCVITLTEELALKQAERAEKEIAEGKYRGPLHGIPCGVKDLFATKGIPTTWGAEPYRHQVFDYDAAVVEKLEAAGAILLAKLSMGALAQDDIWFKGKTKKPLESGGRFERFERRFRVRRVRRSGSVRDWHGNAGQHCFAEQSVPGHGTAAYLRARQPLRGDGLELHNGQNRADLPRSGRLRVGFRGAVRGGTSAIPPPFPVHFSTSRIWT